AVQSPLGTERATCSPSRSRAAVSFGGEPEHRHLPVRPVRLEGDLHARADQRLLRWCSRQLSVDERPFLQGDRREDVWRFLVEAVVMRPVNRGVRKYGPTAGRLDPREVEPFAEGAAHAWIEDRLAAI